MPRGTPVQTRERLVQAAFWEIYLMGFRSARLDRILEDAKVTKGALYHHFPSKAALGHAVVDEVIEPLIYQWWIRPLQASGDPLENLLLMNDRLSDREFVSLVVERGCPLNNLGQEMSAIDPDFRRRVEKVLELWCSRVAQALESAREQQMVIWNIDPDREATFIVASLEGSVAMAKIACNDRALRACHTALGAYLAGLRSSATAPV